jgi:CBS domain-containing protein
MKAIDVMTFPVVSIAPDTPVREITALLFERRIGALPVLEEGRLAGIVTEGDLLRAQEIGTAAAVQRGGCWLRRLLQDRSIDEYIDSYASQARDVMTREVVSVREDAALADMAALMQARGFRRLPVLRDGKLVGIVSRAKLAQALAAAAHRQEPAWL